MQRAPSDPFANGRSANGRFGKGNPGGPGSPYSKKVHALRRALLEAVTEDEIKQVVAALLREAKLGNVQAARELLSRCLGPAEAVDLIERMDALEELLESARPQQVR